MRILGTYKKAPACKNAVPPQPDPVRQSAAGNLSEAAKKAGQGVADAACKAVGMRPTRVQKSGSQ